MKLPRAGQAVVQEAKITTYLLSETHPVGKAGFFLRFGFHPGNWQVLADAFRAHALEHEVSATQDSPHGTRNFVEGPLNTPQGRRPLVRTVWIVDKGAELPRLVSAYPLPGTPS